MVARMRDGEVRILVFVYVFPRWRGRCAGREIGVCRVKGVDGSNEENEQYSYDVEVQMFSYPQRSQKIDSGAPLWRGRLGFVYLCLRCCSDAVKLKEQQTG